jgi:hypothetical protein
MFGQVCSGALVRQHLRLFQSWLSIFTSCALPTKLTITVTQTNNLREPNHEQQQEKSLCGSRRSAPPPMSPHTNPSGDKIDIGDAAPKTPHTNPSGNEIDINIAALEALWSPDDTRLDRGNRGAKNATSLDDSNLRGGNFVLDSHGRVATLCFAFEKDRRPFPLDTLPTSVTLFWSS